MTRLDDIKLWVFDLDNTLYADETGIGRQMHRRMTDYVAQILGVDGPQAADERSRMFRQYGTTMRGLMVEHGTDPHHFMDYVHDLDITHLAVDTALRDGLARLPGQRVIYTNASARHAQRITAALGIDDLFTDMFDIAAADFAPKPDPAPYLTMLGRVGATCGKGAAMFEDMAINLKPAHDLGMATVLIETPHNRHSPAAAHIHHRAPCIRQWLADLAL